MITVFKNIYSKEPFYIEVDKALDRIQKGNSKQLCEDIRATIDKEKRQSLKSNLPAVLFSGTFSKERKDESLIKHSGFIVLDLDNIENVREVQTDIISNGYVYACWISPSGNGLKILIKIADGKKHREHFAALKELFPLCDSSGQNESRVCYESYDPEIYIYPDADIFTKTKKTEKVYEKQQVNLAEEEVFKKLLVWLSNKNEAFVTGERNNFIFKLASACCKFGINELSCAHFIDTEFLVDSQFSRKESDRTIRSAYKANSLRYGTASFDKEILVDKVTRQEIKLDPTIFDESIRPKDVIYGVDVKEKALQIYDTGYNKVDGVGVPELDLHFKPKRGEITLLTGIGNYGKSAFKKWYHCMRILMYGEKFASFSPEDNPPEEYYHDYVEILLGCDCTPSNPNRPNRQTYEYVYDWISKHVFYVYPKDVEPTPTYVMEIFLELIIKEKVDGCDIDPFNQMTNDYGRSGGRSDKYLEWVLALFARFAQMNDVFFWIIAHPKLIEKGGDGNYKCPDVFDVNDGAMWNNKMDNILVYHRPFAQTEPPNPTCELHSKKIRRQKTVGKKGSFIFEMKFDIRRFIFNTIDPLRVQLNKADISFDYNKPIVKEQTWMGFKDNDKTEELPF